MLAPRTFSMQLPDALLVFDASTADATGEYEVYSISRDDERKLWREWDVVREGLTPTGRIPVTDVDFDEARGFRIHTLGIERFART